MKLIIAGGRDYQFTQDDLNYLDGIGSNVTEVVSGACQAKTDDEAASGADGFGEAWAESKGVPIKRFYPDWKSHGRGAGPRRNIMMAEYADAVALFPGGRGTDSMCREAKKRGLKVFDAR